MLEDNAKQGMLDVRSKSPECETKGASKPQKSGKHEMDECNLPQGLVDCTGEAIGNVVCIVFLSAARTAYLCPNYNNDLC